MVKKPISHDPGVNHTDFDGYNGRVLVADDDADVREVICLALDRVGVEISAVGSASEAMAVFNDYRPDVLISDWKMPGMDGIDLVSHLKKRDPHLASILITGFGTKETIIEAFTRGKINYYVSKPFKVDELLEVVSAALKERKLSLSEQAFRLRLEKEIQLATQELEEKNLLLEQKNIESESLYRELQTRQEEVEQTKNYLEGLLESSVDAIISTDQDYRISFFSKGAEEMLGYKSLDVTGRPLDFLFVKGGEEPDRLIKLLAIQKRVKHFETELLGTSGQKIVGDISASTLRHRPKRQGLLLIIKDIGARKRLEEELRSSNIVLEKLSVTDGLTELFNHRHFQRCLSEEFQRARRYSSNLSLIMLDLDDFKMVNDTYGHPIGDQVLMLMADLIRESVREVDIPARYGGEEFAIILPQTDVEKTILVAERLKNAIEQSLRYHHIASGLTMTASIGLTGYPDPGIASPQDLIRLADKALLRAKHIGKNRIVIGMSNKEIPLGRGEQLTHAEKKMILRRVGDTLRSSLDLSEVLDYLLQEVSSSLRQSDMDPACSIMVMDKKQGLKTAAEINMESERQADFTMAAHRALEKRDLVIVHEHDTPCPITSYPIMAAWPNWGEEVVGVINIGTIPADLEFFRDLTNQASFSIVRAKLFHEVDVSKKALERKVDQLITLSLMSLAMQRNALNYDKFQIENNKLLARCLARIGFRRALVYRYNSEKQMIFSGVDDSFRGENTPDSLSLTGADQSISFMRSTAPKIEPYAPNVYLARPEDLTSDENKLLEDLDLVGGQVAFATVYGRGKVRGLIFGLKDTIDDEDLETMSMFVLHASLIMENLQLSQLFQDKARRLTLIHEIGLELSTAATHEARGKSVRHALTGLREILQAGEISLYSLATDKQSLELVAYISDSAKPESGPSAKIELKDSPLMNRVVKTVFETGRPTPFMVNDLSSILGKRIKKRYRTGSYMGLPLFGGGLLLGVMNVTDKLDRTEFSQDDLDLAQIATGMLGTALYGITLIRGIENQAMETVRDVAGHFDAHLSDIRPGHTRRVVELTAGLAKTFGLDDSEVEHLRQATWIHNLKQKAQSREEDSPEDPLHKTALVLGEWFWKMRNVLDLTRGVEAGPKEDPSKTRSKFLKKMIPVAEAFEGRYLGLKPQKRPDLADLLFELIEETSGNLDREAVEVLIIGLMRGTLKNGPRLIKPKTEVFSRLSEKLNGVSKEKEETLLMKEAVEEYIKLITEELNSRNAQKTSDDKYGK